MFLQIAPLFLAATLAMILIAVLPPGVSGGTHIDVGLGQNRFFLGEQFLITFKDVIYWVAGMCMGLLFAMTFLLGDIGGIMGMKEKSSKRGSATPKEDTGATRDKRLIGSKMYPVSCVLQDGGFIRLYNLHKLKNPFTIYFHAI